MEGMAVIQTQPNAENRVAGHLMRQGFEYYSPKCWVVRRGRRIVRPLFPTYMFVSVIDRWRALLSTFGVRRLLMADFERPAVIGQHIINGWKRRERDGVILLDRMARFARGQRVIVESGPMAGQLGIYEHQLDHERVRILLRGLGRKIRVSVAEETLSPA